MVLSQSRPPQHQTLATEFACVADALNLLNRLYKWFRQVRGPAATQATIEFVFGELHYETYAQGGESVPQQPPYNRAYPLLPEDLVTSNFLRGCSLRKHPFLFALRRWGRFARRNVTRRARRNRCFRRLQGLIQKIQKGWVGGQKKEPTFPDAIIGFTAK